MPTLHIDNQPVTVEPGATILDAAEKLGIRIPTLCYLKGHPALTSCMVCVVKVKGLQKLLPACATRAEDSMVIESECEEVRDARRTAFELLLGDHLGDCIGPCQGACPAQMDIPLMIRHISNANYADAIKVVKERIALPATLGRICPEICEKVCRRASKDSAVSICLLKRFVADLDLQSDAPYIPQCKQPRGMRVAIVGAGPTGLAAAYHLLQEGIGCVIFDCNDRPGGALRDVPADRLPPDVLDAEIGLIRNMGAEFRMGVALGTGLSIDALRAKFNAVLIAAGKLTHEQTTLFGLEMAAHGLRVDKHTMMTSSQGVFAAGSSVTPSKLAIRSIAEGQAAAGAIVQYLNGEEIFRSSKFFTVRMGRVSDDEMSIFMANASASKRVKSSDNCLNADEAGLESARCLHCECGKLDGCKLRDFSVEYEADPAALKGIRKKYERYDSHQDVIFEPGKCISCGVCVQITEELKEPLGLTFVGRGFQVQVKVPFGESLSQGLKDAAIRCAESCPTGALVLRGNQ